MFFEVLKGRTTRAAVLAQCLMLGLVNSATAAAEKPPGFAPASVAEARFDSRRSAMVPKLMLETPAFSRNDRRVIESIRFFPLVAVSAGSLPGWRRSPSVIKPELSAQGNCL